METKQQGNGRESTTIDYHVAAESQRGLLVGTPDIIGADDDMAGISTQDRILAALEAVVAEQKATNLMLNRMPAGNGNGKSKWWLGPATTVLAAAAVVFSIRYQPVAQSNAEKDIQALQIKFEIMQEQMKELDRLKKLYLIRYGEDPDQVTPETIKRPQRR